MTLHLDALTADQVEQARTWRNAWRESTRTPILLTEAMQDDFYRSVICDRNAPHRYWAIVGGTEFLGMGGLTFIQWENRLAEISLILNPKATGQGYGTQAVALLLEEGFRRMGLLTIVGECYECNAAVDFWRAIAKRYDGDMTTLPRRKFWDGKLWDALYFSIARDGFERIHGR